jgi:hypothetical protein
MAEEDGWVKVDRCVEDAKKQLENATTEEQFQSIGLLCRETLISLAQLVYISSNHPPLDGILPSKTDAKRMLEAYLTVELAGGANEAARKHARAALDLANDLQHNRTANYLDAALCTEATTSVVSLISLISGHAPRASIQDINVEFSYQAIDRTRVENLYQLGVVVTNTGKRVIKNFKLEFEFPDLDSVPLKWIPLGNQHQSSGPLVELTPKDEAVSSSKNKSMLCISYQSSKPLFLTDKFDVGELVGLKYRINSDIYSNIEEFPSLRWKLYADNMMPKQGEIFLSQLNNF